MSGDSRKLVFAALTIASISLLVSGICLAYTFTQTKSIETLLTAKLADLEEEHDYLLEAGAESDSQPNAAAASQSGSQQRPSLCYQLPAPGPCNSQITRWYFLEREGDCLEFPWGGCQGNNNNFLSLAQCRSACRVPANQPRPAHLASGRGLTAGGREVVRQLLPPPSTDHSISTDCFLPPDAGSCGRRMTRYYHADGQCQRFHYSGCAGNKNNFLSRAECLSACVAVQDEQIANANELTRPASAAKQICSLPEDIGECDNKITRFRWDSRLRECVRFEWSGCGGNSNNFISIDKCKNRCQL